MLTNAQPPREYAAAYLLKEIGSVLSSRCQHSEVLDYHRRALEIRKRYSDELRISTSLVCIGLIYRRMGQYDKALDYMKQSLRIKQKSLSGAHHIVWSQ